MRRESIADSDRDGRFPWWAAVAMVLFRRKSELRNLKSEFPRIGLVAGWGRFPVVVAQALKAQGCQVFCLGVRGHADASLATICDAYRPIGVARLGGAIRYFRRQGIHRATLAGKVFKHKALFGRFGWLSLVPDLRTVRAFLPHFVQGRKARNDDALLTVIVEEFARDGITMTAATDFAPELLAPTVSLIDKMVNKGIIHRNTAARYKSRLTKHVAELA